MVHRGLNPKDVELPDALAYFEHRPDIIVEQQNIWKEAAADLFGDQ